MTAATTRTIFSSKTASRRIGRGYRFHNRIAVRRDAVTSEDTGRALCLIEGGIWPRGGLLAGIAADITRN
jgi:hypothetical protein